MIADLSPVPSGYYFVTIHELPAAVLLQARLDLPETEAEEFCNLANKSGNAVIVGYMQAYEFPHHSVKYDGHEYAVIKYHRELNQFYTSGRPDFNEAWRTIVDKEGLYRRIGTHLDTITATHKVAYESNWCSDDRGRVASKFIVTQSNQVHLLTRYPGSALSVSHYEYTKADTPEESMKFLSKPIAGGYDFFIVDTKGNLRPLEGV